MRPFAIEIYDGSAEKTRFEFNYEQDEKNKRVPNLLSLAFPMRSKDTFSLFFKIRTCNPFMLCAALEQFIEGMNLMKEYDANGIIEFISEEVLKKTAIKFAPLQDSVLVLIDLGPTEVGNFFEETLTKAFKVFGPAKPNVYAEVSFDRDFKDLIDLVTCSKPRSTLLKAFP